MKKNILIVAVLLLCTQLFFACGSAKPAGVITSVTKQTELTLNSCEQTIKYISSKAIDSRSQTDIDMSMEIIIDPTEKLITLNLDSHQKGKGSISATVVSSDCNLNSSLTEGYSVYQALGQGPGGQNKEVSFRVEAKKECLTILYTDEKEKGELMINVDKWEVVKQ